MLNEKIKSDFFTVLYLMVDTSGKIFKDSGH